MGVTIGFFGWTRNIIFGKVWEIFPLNWKKFCSWKFGWLGELGHYSIEYAYYGEKSRDDYWFWQFVSGYNTRVKLAA